MLQMREFMLDSQPRAYRAGDVLFERNAPGSSLFAIADGSVLVEVDSNDPDKTVRIPQGTIVGEVGLISGRKRGATVRTAEGAIVIEIPRNAALKLMATNSAAKREITRISTERQLLQMFPSVAADDLVELLETADSMAWSFSARKQGRNGNDWREAARFVRRIDGMPWQRPLFGVER